MMFNKTGFIGLASVAAIAAATLVAPIALADAPIHGSIKLPTAENEKATPTQKAEESKRLAKLAKLTPVQAEAAARKVVKGRAKVDKLMLENEDGYLVYAVFLGGHEVLVDAGNGKILGNEVESASDTESHERGKDKD